MFGASANLALGRSALALYVPVSLAAAHQTTALLLFAADAFIDQAAWGTPAQVIEKIQARRDVIGDYSVMLSPTWGGMPYELAHASMKLVSGKVLPELRTIGA